MLWNCNYRLYPRWEHLKTFLYSSWPFHTQANNSFTVFPPPSWEDLIPERKAEQRNSTHTVASVAIMTKGEMWTCQHFGYLVSMKRTFLLDLMGESTASPTKVFSLPISQKTFTHSSIFITLNIGTLNVLMLNKIKMNEWMDTSLSCLSPTGFYIL